MHRSSETIGAIASALAKAQGGTHQPGKIPSDHWKLSPVGLGSGLPCPFQRRPYGQQKRGNNAPANSARTGNRVIE
jgi:hypothetical protein